VVLRRICSVPVQLVIEHGFPLTSCEAFERVYFDEEYNVAQGVAMHMGRTLKRLDRTPERVVRHILYDPAHEPGTPAAEALKASRRGFIEELDYDLRAHRGSWRTVPNAFADRVKSVGTIEVAMRGDQVWRVVRAELTVRLFGFGARVERGIAAEIEKSYAKSTAFMLEWLKKERG
jgi:hypothetical protein